MNPPDLARLIFAARVPETIGPLRFGPWRIRRHCSAGIPFMTILDHEAVAIEADVHLISEDGAFEVVMEDSRRELSRHLPIFRVARGRVLITGLGLGCVVRGLLAKPDVEHVDVVEIDPLIVAVVGPEFELNPRVTIHIADAMAWRPPAGVRYDFAWHDLYVPRDHRGYSTLQYLHFNLLWRSRQWCDGPQGAWMLPRPVARLYPFPLLGEKKKTRRRKRRRGRTRNGARPLPL